MAAKPPDPMKRVLALLDEAGKLTVQDDALVFRGDKFVIPAAMEGNPAAAVRFLKQQVETLEEPHEISRTFNYRPWDGAAAFQRAMVRVFGTSGQGQVIKTFFGDYPPEYRTIDCGFGKQMQVPWGHVGFKPMDALFALNGTRSKNGTVFALSCTAPRKHRARVEAFFQIVEEELRLRSIYKGQAITAADDPQYFNPFDVDPEQVIYDPKVMQQLEANVFTVLDHYKAIRRLKMPLKRAVLFEGPYGTGKTLGGVLAAQHAVRAGWTFIMVQSGEDPYAALKTAALYGPAVVLIEDIDVLTAGDKNREEVDKLLDALDNAQGKGREVMAIFTSNFAEKIEKGALRPGRIDAVIHVDALEDPEMKRLIQVLIPDLLAPDIDWPMVLASFKGFLPAYASEAAGRAIRYSLARNGGEPDTITDSDLVRAADGLRPQLALMEAASEAEHGRKPLEAGVTALMEGVINRTRDPDSGELLEVRPEGASA